MRKTDAKWTTLDIHEAAYLALHGIPIDLDKINNRVIFTAPQTEELFRLVSEYYANDPTPIADYVTGLKALKTRLFVVKGTMRT